MDWTLCGPFQSIPYLIFYGTLREEILADRKSAVIWRITQKLNFGGNLFWRIEKNIFPEVSTNLTKVHGLKRYLVCSRKDNHISVELRSTYLWKKT